MRLTVLLCLVYVVTSFSAERLNRSLQPPGGLTPRQVPQFIILGFDDNTKAEPMSWYLDQLKERRNPAGTGQSATFDNVRVRMTFFSNGIAWGDPEVVAVHRRAVAEGHELANHSQTHPESAALFSVTRWREEIVTCDQTFITARVLSVPTVGFRAPNLECEDSCLQTLVALGKVYDSSILEDYQAASEGMRFPWPYTLDATSEGLPKGIKSNYPGLWEIPVNAYLVPSDEESERYGIAAGLRRRMQNTFDRKGGFRSESGLYQPISGRMNGIDLSYMNFGGASSVEYLAILKHTLDQRLASNRAPVMILGHTWFYPADHPERREAMKEFLDYALSKPEVRFVTARQLVDWLRDPVALRPHPPAYF